jgi:hypothetical protein
MVTPRETSAIAVAAAVPAAPPPSSAASSTIRIASLMPAPAGTGTTRKPTDQAKA